MSFSFQNLVNPDANAQFGQNAKTKDVDEKMGSGNERQPKKFATPAVPQMSQKKRLVQDPVSLSVEEAKIKMSQERRMVAVMSDEINQWIESVEKAYQALRQYDHHLKEVSSELDRMIHFFPLRAVIAQDVESHFQTMAKLVSESKVDDSEILGGQSLLFPACAKVLNDATMGITDVKEAFLVGMVSPIEKAVNRFVNGYNQTLRMDFRLQTLKLLDDTVSASVETIDSTTLTQTEPLAALIEKVSRAQVKVTAALKHFGHLLDEIKTTLKPYQQDFRLKEHIRSDSQASSQLNVIQDAIHHQEVKGLLFHTTRLTQLTRQLLSI